MNITVERILLLLKQNNMKQKDLYQYLGTTQTLISHWISGRSNSYLKYIVSIGDFFNVSVDYLLGKTDIKNPSKLQDMEKVQDSLMFELREKCEENYGNEIHDLQTSIKSLEKSNKELQNLVKVYEKTIKNYEKNYIDVSELNNSSRKNLSLFKELILSKQELDEMKSEKLQKIN